MRTKAILLGAALLAAGVASSMAQSNVYSLNVVGYVNVPILTNGNPSGTFTLIANPLNNTNNTLANLIPTAPLFSQFYSWNGTGFDIATYSFGGWTANPNFPPGAGGILLASGAFTNTFVGTVLQGPLTNSFSSGFALESSKVPVSAGIDTLGITGLNVFDQAYKWNFANQSYDIFTLTFGGWSPSVPVLNVGESMFFQTSGGGSFVTNFVVQ